MLTQNAANGNIDLRMADSGKSSGWCCDQGECLNHRPARSGKDPRSSVETFLTYHGLRYREAKTSIEKPLSKVLSKVVVGVLEEEVWNSNLTVGRTFVFLFGATAF